MVLGLFGMAGVATAAPPYTPPGTLGIGVDDPNDSTDTSVVVGSDFVVFGNGFLPGETIIITTTYLGTSNGLRSARAVTELVEGSTTNASNDGTFDLTAAGLDKVGWWRITATGQTSGYSVSTDIYVSGIGSDGSAGTTTVAADGAGEIGGSGSGGAPAGGNGEAVGNDGLAYTGQGGTSAAGGLAYTGTSVVGPIVIGVAALALGLMLLFFGTRGLIRRNGSDSATG